MQTVCSYLEATLISCFFATLFWKFFEESVHSKKCSFQSVASAVWGLHATNFTQACKSSLCSNLLENCLLEYFSCPLQVLECIV